MLLPNHFRLLVRGHMSNPPKEEARLNEFFKSLVNKVRIPLVDGNASYAFEPGNEGISGTVTLPSSYSSMHVWDTLNPPMFRFELYSCEHFTADEVLEELDSWFQLELANWGMSDRIYDLVNITGAGIWYGDRENVVMDPIILKDAQLNSCYYHHLKGEVCRQCDSIIEADGLCWKCISRQYELSRPNSSSL